MPRVDQYFKIAAASAYLGVSPNTLRKWADEGKVKAHVNPANGYRLFSLVDLDQFLKTLEHSTPVKRKPK